MITTELSTKQAAGYLRHQARKLATKTSHVNDLIASFRANAFDYTQLPPVTIVEYGDGSRTIIDGNHRIKALEAIGSPRVKANILSFTGDLDGSEVKLIEAADAANGNRKPQLAMSNDDLRRTIKLLIKEGKDVDCSKWRTEFGALHSRDGKGLGRIISSAKKDLENEEVNIRTYSDADLRGIAKLHEDIDTAVIYQSTDKWAHGVGSLIKECAEQMVSKGKLILHHRSVSAQRNFELKKVKLTLSLTKLEIEVIVLRS